MFIQVYFKKTKILILVIIIKMTSYSSAQAQNQKLNEEKWIKAIINLDTRQSGGTQLSNLWKDLVSKKIDSETYQIRSQEIHSNLNRFTGSALYFKYNGREYLLTARHVLEDTSDEIREYGERVFNKFFLVDNYQDYLKNKGISDHSPRTMVMNINAGTPDMRPFAFSKTSDIAIIGLNTRSTSNLRKTLKDRNYIPIDFADIDTTCNIKPGNEIFSVGFTSDLFLLGKKQISTAEMNWESELVTVPILSKGTVDILINETQFAGNIFVYTGNSGGPIIFNNKLVGIVTGGTYTENIAAGFLYYRRLLIMVKSSEILPLLKDVEQRVIQNEIFLN